MKFIPWIRLHHVHVFASALCSFFLVGWLIWLMQFGIDLTDESYYLVWIDNPFKYSVSLTQFGFFYHPFYWLLDGHIAALRQLNLLATSTLTYLLAISLLQTFFVQAPLSRLERNVFAAAMSVGAFTFLRLWLPTPSYNWLCFQGLLLAAIGLVWAEHRTSRSSKVGWVLIGVAGWMVFMAKPSSALALAVCAPLYLFIAGKARLRLMLLSICITSLLLLCSALMIDGSVELFMTRLRDAIGYARMMGSGYSFGTILRVDTLDLASRSQLLIYAGAAVLCALSVAALSRRSVAFVGSALLQLCAVVATVMIALGYMQPFAEANGYPQLFLLLVLLAAAVLNLSAKCFGCVQQLNRAQWSLVVLFIALPYVFAFGSNNNYWFMQGLVGIFWVFAGLIMLLPHATHPRFRSVLMAFGITVQLITVCAIANGIAHPYYQPQLLYKNDALIQIAGKESTLRVASSYADYIANLRHESKSAGFTKGTPVIDLSGHSPGIPYILEGQNTSQAWIIGNYPGYTGSEAVTEAMLKRTPCDELARAWIFVEPKGSVSISMNVVKGFGAHPVQDFKKVVQVEAPVGLVGFKSTQIQQFLKPVRPYDIAVKACQTKQSE